MKRLHFFEIRRSRRGPAGSDGLVVISTGIASNGSVISPADRIEPRGEFAPPYREGYRRYPEIYRCLRPAADPVQS